MSVDRSDIHRLVDEIPPDDLTVVERLLRIFAEANDPVLKTLLLAEPAADPLTPHEQAAIKDFEAAKSRGEQFKAAHPDSLLEEFGFNDTSQ